MKLLFIAFLLLPSIIFGHVLEQKEKPFKAIISNIPLSIETKVKKYSWHPGCPVPLKDLRYLRMTYWGFDDKTHRGSMIINKSLAREVTQMFKLLYENKFPIEHMELIDKYKGNDKTSMSANNTSAFNCRDLTGLPGLFSQHSYGRAIDINPQINPYLNGKIILPKNGTRFIDRHKPYKGKITKNCLIYRIFVRHGWDWAGNWYDVQDYQHFEKRAHGAKRNPYGSHSMINTHAFHKKTDKLPIGEKKRILKCEDDNGLHKLKRGS